MRTFTNTKQLYFNKDEIQNSIFYARLRNLEKFDYWQCDYK